MWSSEEGAGEGGQGTGCGTGGMGRRMAEDLAGWAMEVMEVQSPLVHLLDIGEVRRGCRRRREEDRGWSGLGVGSWSGGGDGGGAGATGAAIVGEAWKEMTRLAEPNLVTPRRTLSGRR